MPGRTVPVASAAGDRPGLPAQLTPRLRGDVVVVGAGVIGLVGGLAGRLRRSAPVPWPTPSPARGASWVAAGMLAPVTEVHYGEEALLALTLASARRWPASPPSSRPSVAPSATAGGTLLVAVDDGRPGLGRGALSLPARTWGSRCEWLSRTARPSHEPALAPGVRCGLLGPGDHQVHNRRLLAALVTACADAGVAIVHETVPTPWRCTGGAVTGVRLAAGASVAAPAVVLAAGCRSPLVAGLPAEAVPAGAPGEGPDPALASPDGSASAAHRCWPTLGTVRALVAGGVGLPRPPRRRHHRGGGDRGGAGASTPRVTAGAVYELLRDARRVVPGITEMVLDEATAGLRRGRPTTRPSSARPRRRTVSCWRRATTATGILLAPLTAEAVVPVVRGGGVAGGAGAVRARPIRRLDARIGARRAGAML